MNHHSRVHRCRIVLSSGEFFPCPVVHGCSAPAELIRFRILVFRLEVGPSALLGIRKPRESNRRGDEVTALPQGCRSAGSPNSAYPAFPKTGNMELQIESREGVGI